VIGESHPETLPVFIQRAEELRAPLVVADRIYHIDSSISSADGYQVFKVRKNASIPYPNLKCALLGHYQRKNTVTLISAIDQLREVGFNLEEKIIYTGIKNVIRNTGLAGRWQITGHEPVTVIDTAHNADGLNQVVQQITETPHEKLHMIIGFVNDKDVDSMLSLLPRDADYYFARLSVPRTMDEKVLESKALAAGIKGISFPSVKEAYAGLHDKTGPNDLVVITGSTFLVADFLSMNIPVT
jgi:dihydrofolate synthase/folylpolyglutamate synthase